MEVEPLQDTLPPRHQVESDESEDEDAYPLVSAYTKQHPPSPVVNINWNNSSQTRSNLLVAFYEAGRYWIQGVQLGDIRGDIVLNNTVIGKIYTPEWADALILVIDTRVPLYTMPTIASTVLLSTNPKSLSLIDSYPLPLYISASSQSSNVKPPIRYLRTYTKTRLLKAEPFSPPNILQCLAAAFLPLAEYQKLPATILLLPSPYITPPAPPRIISSSFGPSVREEWETEVMENLHKDVCATLGSGSIWRVDNASKGIGRSRMSRKGDIGEGGMYL